MPTDDGEQPFIDSGGQEAVGKLLARTLEEMGSPDSLIDGGASDSEPYSRRPRNHAELERREAIYANGGVITEFIDTRALMTYGTGVSFETTDDTITDDQDRTVAEWCDDQFSNLAEHFIQRGIQTYVFGDAWPEIVETRGGGFSHVTLVDPTTVNPSWDAHGNLTEIQQIVATDRGRVTQQSLDSETVGHYWFKKATSGPLGESLIAQNHDEIQRYAQNQTQRANAIRLHGSPKYHVAVGSDGQSISDRILRRVRNRFSSTNTDEKTNWVTGGDIEISELDTPGFEGMQSITETDIALLSSGFGVPLEYTNFGADGLGSGTPAESRQLKFERQARAEQRRAAEQFEQEVLYYILREYSPFDPDIDVSLVFGDVVSDTESTAEWLRDFKSYFTPEEVREHLGFAPADGDADLGPPEGTPDAESGGDDFGGLFQDAAAESGNASRRALFHGEAAADDLTQAELVWEDLYERVLWNDDADATARALFAFDPEEVPAFVMENLREAVESGAVFSSFETIPDYAEGRIQQTLLDSLDEGHGWSIDSLTQNIQDLAPGIDELDAERIARTETQALVAQAREQGYAEQFDTDIERFRWVGPSDTRTTETCETIKERVGDGVPLSELKGIVEEVATEHGHSPREWTPHISCRHTFVRAT